LKLDDFKTPAVQTIIVSALGNSTNMFKYYRY